MPDANTTVPENRESRNSILPPASRCLSLGDGLKRWQSFNSAAELALIVSGLHPDATVRPRGIDATAVVFAEKLALAATIEQHRHALLDDLLHHLIHVLAGVVTIRLDQSWFAEHVDLVALDKKMALATGSALIALKLCHCQIVARRTFGASRIQVQRQPGQRSRSE